MSAVGMPPHILALFAARPPLDFQKPLVKRKMPDMEGLVGFEGFLDPDDVPPIRLPFETPKQRLLRIRKERIQAHLNKQQELIDEYSPSKDEKATEDPYKTLFVSRMSYSVQEEALSKEFEKYGPIKKIRLVKDLQAKLRGYAFIEYESERDMKNAYKHADGTKLDGRRVCVDVERARTVEGWMPRRLGGGRGPGRGSSSVSSKGGLHASSSSVSGGYHKKGASVSNLPDSGRDIQGRGNDRGRSSRRPERDSIKPQGISRGPSRRAGERERSRSRDRRDSAHFDRRGHR